MWFVELYGRMDGRQPDGNRVAKITLDGKVTEYPIPSTNGSPINIAVGPDRNIWFTKAGKLGRVTRDGRITEFDLPWANAGPTGLSAGSDRCPPNRLIDKLWFTESAGNRLAFLSFR
jgi:virginiamycin B lyase